MQTPYRQPQSLFPPMTDTERPSRRCRSSSGPLYLPAHPKLSKSIHHQILRVARVQPPPRDEKWPPILPERSVYGETRCSTTRPTAARLPTAALRLRPRASNAGAAGSASRAARIPPAPGEDPSESANPSADRLQTARGDAAAYRATQW